MSTTLEDLQQVDVWVKQHVKGCKVVGISDDLELFLEYSDPDEQIEEIVCEKIKEVFADKIKKVISVFKPSIRELEEAIQELNKILAGEEKPATPLLQIGEF